MLQITLGLYVTNSCQATVLTYRDQAISCLHERLEHFIVFRCFILGCCNIFIWFSLQVVYLTASKISLCCAIPWLTPSCCDCTALPQSVAFLPMHLSPFLPLILTLWEAVARRTTRLSLLILAEAGKSQFSAYRRHCGRVVMQIALDISCLSFSMTLNCSFPNITQAKWQFAQFTVCMVRAVYCKQIWES